MHTRMKFYDTAEAAPSCLGCHILTAIYTGYKDFWMASAAR